MPKIDAESPVVGRLRQELGEAVREHILQHGEETVVVAPERVEDALRILRDDRENGYPFLADLCGLDRLKLDPDHPEERFGVVYHLADITSGKRIRVRTHVPDRHPRLRTASSLWQAANWLEREAYDLYGIEFEGHPDLRRILMPDDYDGHPLRKDYPLRGRGERHELQMVAGAPPHFRQPMAMPSPGLDAANAAAARHAMDFSHELDEDRLEEFRQGRVSFTDVEGAPGETMLMNFGPQHPATHGTLRTVMELDGERVRRAAPEIGFLHSGFEKLGENRKYNDFITVTDRMNYLSPMANNFGYVMAVERLLDLEIPKRAQYIRVILYEMARISDHMLSIGSQALDLGAFTAFLYGFTQRETLYDIFEAVCGARFTVSYARVGGLANDVPEDFGAMTRKFLAECPKAIDDIANLLDHNRIWLDRTRGVGALSVEDAVSYGVTGPAMRATGVPWDLRQSDPYSSYEDFDFEVAVGENGDVYDRYLCRMEEMRQSLRIIEQGLAKLPGGPVFTDDERVAIPAKDKVYGSIEGLIYHFKQIMDGHGFHPDKGEAYGYSEAPNGELGYYVVSDGSMMPYRIRVRPPSFFHYQVFPHLLEGRLLSDAVAILSSLNVIAGELDR